VCASALRRTIVHGSPAASMAPSASLRDGASATLDPAVQPSKATAMKGRQQSDADGLMHILTPCPMPRQLAIL